ncbi:MAG: 2-amino-4-hydroxy-6-hydroxymethyldihydropteridine diphosphokinase, partial [Pseudomonadota bacterium]
MTETIWVSIGSNIEPDKHIRAAIHDLRHQFGTVTPSPVYQTPASGFAGEDFYNLVAGFDTDLPLTELQRRLRQIEADNGRVRTAEKFSARTLDIDVMLYGDQISDNHGKPVPSPEILEYAFVLKPLADIIPQQKYPQQQVSYQ